MSKRACTFLQSLFVVSIVRIILLLKLEMCILPLVFFNLGGRELLGCSAWCSSLAAWCCGWSGLGGEGIVTVGSVCSLHFLHSVPVLLLFYKASIECHSHSFSTKLTQSVCVVSVVACLDHLRVGILDNLVSAEE